MVVKLHTICEEVLQGLEVIRSSSELTALSNENHHRTPPQLLIDETGTTGVLAAVIL
jgi:hypothetical protein